MGGYYLSGRSSQGQYRGSRATRDGGNWELFRDAAGSAVCATEIYGYTDLAPTAGSIMLKEELRLSMSKAAQGKLRFGEKDDVGEIYREPDMLELRLGYRAFDSQGGVPYKFRLYFAEPTAVLRLLLGLKFGKAPATEAGLKVQDEQIDKAGDRYMAWTQARVK